MPVVRSKVWVTSGPTSPSTQRLKTHARDERSKAGHWITISGNDEVRFNIFRLESGQLLGCLPVVRQLDVRVNVGLSCGVAMHNTPQVPTRKSDAPLLAAHSQR
jgi:hypothetical protein